MGTAIPKRIMIIEDDPCIRELLELVYEAEGYTVVTAADGSMALHKLHGAKELPKVILLDLMMPGMDGFEFRSHQKQDKRLAGIPIIVMTANANAQAKAKELGARECFKKPFADLELLLNTVEQFFVKQNLA
jgi:CheY-like chemotaxis protein